MHTKHGHDFRHVHRSSGKLTRCSHGSTLAHTAWPGGRHLDTKRNLTRQVGAPWLAPSMPSACIISYKIAANIQWSLVTHCH